MSDAKRQPPRPEQDGQKDSPFERFESLTKRLVAVPKKEIERRSRRGSAGRMIRSSAKGL